MPIAHNLTTLLALRGHPAPQVGNLTMVWVRLGKARLPALVATLVASTAACGAALHVAAPVKPVSAPATPDDEVTACREAVERAVGGSDADKAAAALASALQKALKFHVERAEIALGALSLTEAEGEIIQAASYDAFDLRVVDIRGRAADVRSKCTLALGQARGLLNLLSGPVQRSQDVNLWQELIEAIAVVVPWSGEFPEIADLRAKAAPIVANWFVYLATAAQQTGDVAAARKHADTALLWHAKNAAAAALKDKLASAGQVAATRAKVKALLDANQPEAALQASDDALKAYPADAAVLTVRKAAAQQIAAQMVAVAKKALAEGRVADTAVAVAAARQLAKEDPALVKTLDSLVKDFSKKVDKALGGQANAAIAARNTGAAWIKLLALRAVLGADAKRDARIGKLDADLTAQSLYRVAINVAALPKDQAKELPAAMPGQVAASTTAVVRTALQGGGLEGKAIEWAVQPATADATVAVAWQAWSVARKNEVEPRKKDYLDHTEMALNPGWDQAQAKQAATMAKMNAANDELRPVLDEFNKAEAALHQLQLQIAELLKKIEQEDDEKYRDKPMPCPDGTTKCPQSWANLRWKAHREYYVKRIDDENRKLEVLAPKLAQLQTAYDAARAEYDRASDVAEKAPRKVPKEVWLPFEYEVMRHSVQIKVRGELILREGQGKASTIRHQSAPALDDVRQDYATGNVIVKGQLLEAQHGSQLPEDATLVAEVARKVLDPALAPVKEALATHAERWIVRSEAAKIDDERVHFLVLAWRARGALAADRTDLVARRLRDLAGLDAANSTVDVSRLELSK